MMTTPTAEQTIQKLEIVRETEIAAPMEVVFETILEQLGPLNETPDGKPLKMKLEAWPGGRWYRDLGNNAGHLWAHVQSIRPNDLLELHGPLFMSAAAVSHILYRLSEQGRGTLVKFSHRAVGLIPPHHFDPNDASKGWTYHLARVKESAERRGKG
jgi:uncharacterized protein YndB with AHSA1/START domain